MDFRFALRRQIADTSRVQGDGVQVLAEFVVQLTRKVTALIFLCPDVFTRETAVVGEEPFGFLFKRAAMQQLPLRLAITTPGKPRKAQRQHDQRGRKLVQLEAFETTREGIREFADIEAHAERSSEHR